MLDIGVFSLVIVGEEDKLFLVVSDYMVKKIFWVFKVVILEVGYVVNID